jgi:CubicO group peptidase (beta-lactamase class C family)
MSLDAQDWQDWLIEGTRVHRIPGAALAVLSGDEIIEAATGVLSRTTGVEATADSVWQIGSITKVFTTTQIMLLIERGELDLETRVADVLPGFRVADADVSARLTVRHLLTHTSGIDGDVVIDAGRGDDAVARYVAGLVDVAQLHPLGGMLSYCNAGWIVAGRIVEVITGSTWDRALTDMIVEPLGLQSTVVLPDDAVMHRVAVGHVPRHGAEPDPVPAWGFSRSWGPANQITASVGDVLTFARMHLDGGRNADGQQVLAPELVAEMQTPQADMANPTRRVDHLGLGWWLCDWGERTVYGHDGNTQGQSCFLRVDPKTRTAAALVTNGRTTATLAAELFQRAFGPLDGITIPVLHPPVGATEVATESCVGVYERRAIQITVTATEAGLHASVRGKNPRSSRTDEIDLVPLGREDWALQAQEDGPWSAWRFGAASDGSRFVHDGLQITPKVGS